MQDDAARSTLMADGLISSLLESLRVAVNDSEIAVQVSSCPLHEFIGVSVSLSLIVLFAPQHSSVTLSRKASQSERASDKNSKRVLTFHICNVNTLGQRDNCFL